MSTDEDTQAKTDVLKGLAEGKDNADVEDIEYVDYLSERLHDTENKLRKERFLFFMIAIIVFDSFLFTFFQYWAAPVCITILEIIAIAYIGRVHDIEEIELITDKILSTINKAKARVKKNKNKQA